MWTSFVESGEFFIHIDVLVLVPFASDPPKMGEVSVNTFWRASSTSETDDGPLSDPRTEMGEARADRVRESKRAKQNARIFEK